MSNYPVIGLHTLLAMPPPPMLIEHLIPRQGITGISADPNIGKTFLAIEMARAVVTGTPFLGHFPAQTGAVLFIGQDASILDYARQVRKVIRKEYEAQLADKDDDSEVTDFDDRLKFIIRPGLQLEVGDHVDKLIATVEGIQHSFTGGGFTDYTVTATGEIAEVSYEPYQYGVSLIIIDTLAASHRCNENDNSEMQIVFDNIRKVSEATKAAVVIIHHHPKGNEFNAANSRWRGATSQLGSLDNHLELTRPGGTDDLILLSIKKFRGLKIEDFTYRMAITEDDAVIVKADKSLQTGSLINTDADFIMRMIGESDEPVLSTTILRKFRVVAGPEEKDAAVSSRMYRALKFLRTTDMITKANHGSWIATPKKGTTDV